MNRIKEYTYEEAVNLKKFLPAGLGLVYDLGAGKRDSPVSVQVKDIVCQKLVSVEAFEPYHQELLKGGHSAQFHDIVSKNITETRLEDCDLVLMIDVIEHLPKFDALLVLRYARKKSKCIIIFTPEGDTVGYSNHDQDNPLQEHKSAWTAKDFERLGFTVTVYEDFHTHVGDKPVGGMWAVWYKDEQ